MRRHAQRVSADILKEEERLEAAFRATTTGRLEPVEPGHHDVDDDDVRPFLADKRDRHFAIGRFTDQGQVGGRAAGRTSPTNGSPSRHRRREPLVT